MVDALERKKAVFLKGVNLAQYQCIIWKSTPVVNPDKSMSDNYGWKRDCDKYVSIMMTLPTVPETPLQLIQCGCSKSVCKTSWCKCKSNHFIVLICVTEEQKRTHVKLLPVINILISCEQLISCGIRHFLSRINKNALLFDYDL